MSAAHVLNDRIHQAEEAAHPILLEMPKRAPFSDSWPCTTCRADTKQELLHTSGMAGEHILSLTVRTRCECGTENTKTICELPRNGSH